MKSFILLFCLPILCLISLDSVAHNGSKHNHIVELNTSYQLYQICKNDLEGFSEKLGGGAYTYPSLREDVGRAMISRATTGKMYFEFLTAEVPVAFEHENVNFFFLSDIDLNLRQPYDIIVNGQLVLTFLANEDGSLGIVENPGGGNAEYILIKRDLNGDGIGAFRLTIPATSLEKGKKARVKVQGHAKGSNSWFMLFEASDVIERLKVSAESESAFSIKQVGEQMVIDAPGHFAGETVQLVSDGRKSKKVSFAAEGQMARAVVKAQAPRKSFQLMCKEDVLDMDFPNGDGNLISSDIIGRFFYHFKSAYQDDWSASITKLYRPEFFSAYSDFFERRYEDGKVAILNSSHQDIAWVDRPEVCKILRDTLLLTPILKDAFQRQDYGFDIEDGLMLREYIDRHPESTEKITELLNRKLVSVGATYNCPYEDMYDAEDQVRQLYLGKRWIKKTFGGYDSKVYWNVDVPGKTMQYPQILKKAGVDYMVVSRHARGMFYWASPDGSAVFTYSPGHYGNDIIHLSKDIGSKIKYGAEQVVEWDKYFQSSINHTPLLSDQDMLPAIDYSEFIETWNNFESVKDEEGKDNAVYFPDMELMTVDEFLPLAEQYSTGLDTIYGERPNVWIYIHGPSHHDAVSASREASKLLPAAEKFLSIANIIDPVKMPYPTQTIDQAWQSKIYPDHGWGGHDGDITDNLFKEEYVKSRDISSRLLGKGTEFIAGRVAADDSKGIPVMLFNSLSWNRTDPVQINVSMVKGQAKDIKVLDTKGKEIVSQLGAVEKYPDGSIKTAEVTFIAVVPSIGYSTYYIEAKKPVNAPRYAASGLDSYENDFYKISFVPGGIAQIYDKELRKELLDVDELYGGEVFTMQSVGNGAGEFGDVQQPTMVDFDKVSQHQPGWTVVDNGPVFVSYSSMQQIKDAVVEQKVTIYHELKQVFFETKLLNWTGAMFREFRTAFPINMDKAQISYEVPFGEVKVGEDEIMTAGERYVPLCKDVHPRSVIDWFAATDDDMRIVLSSSVAAFDWIDPTRESDKTLLQHILLASRKSCHWEGNEYSQAGNHSYRYMLTSNGANEVMGDRLAKQHNDPLYIVVNPERSISANLPESVSFISLDNENVIISAVKKSEVDNDLVVRMYDAEGARNEVNLKVWRKLEALFHTNIIEEDPKRTEDLLVPEYSIETFKLQLEK